MDIKLLCFAYFLPLINFSSGSWGSPDSSQYHIQTDEGPERYFRYQTDNGQYRKEKRLKDGTVIGTDAWISADGYLRQKDYIADKDGYRILKSKTVFVGKNRPIQEAINEAKGTPAQAGILVPSTGNQVVADVKPVYAQNVVAYIPPVSSTPSPPVTASNPLYLPPVYSSTTPAPPATQLYLPPSSTVRPQNEAYLPPLVIYNKPSPSSTPAPLALIDNNYYSGSTTPSSVGSVHITPYRPSYYPTSTPASIKVSGDESHLPPLALYNKHQAIYDPLYNTVSSTTARPVFVTSTHQPGLYAIITSNAEPKHSHPSSVSNVLLPPKQYYSYGAVSSTTAAPPSNYKNTNIVNVQPLVNRYSYNPKPAESQSQYYNYNSKSNYGNKLNYKLGDGYNSQYANYDGVSATSNGFRYFLPRQYHEEQNVGGGRRDGSFGYIDPFGIRRVVYYNAGPDGFVHRKNNRYVGFNATPYDPRPV